MIKNIIYIFIFLIFNQKNWAFENSVKFIPLSKGVEKYTNQFETKMEVTDFNKDEEVFDANIAQCSLLSEKEFGIMETAYQRQFIFDILFLNDDGLFQKYNNLNKEKLTSFKAYVVKVFTK